MKIIILTPLMLMLISCSSLIPSSKNNSRTKESLTPFVIDTTSTLPVSDIHINPLPEWDTDECSESALPAFDYPYLISCIEKFIRNNEYLNAELLLEKVPSRSEELSLIRLRIELLKKIKPEESTEDQRVSMVSELELKKAHYTTLIKAIDNQISQADEDSTAITEQWVALVHKLNRLFFMKATYAKLLSIVNEMGSSAPTVSIQKQIHGTLAKAIKRDRESAQLLIDSIDTFTRTQNNFSDAWSTLLLLESRYKHIEENDQYSAIRKIIAQREQHNTTQHATFNSDSLMSVAQNLLQSGKFIEVKTVLQPYIHTQNNGEFDALILRSGEAFCAEKRTRASQYLKESFSHKASPEENRLLSLALNELTACLNEFPQTSKAVTVAKNRELLLQKIEENN